MLVRYLITQAYYRTGLVSPDAGTVNSRQTYDGLNLLNECVAQSKVTNQSIPFLKKDIVIINTEPNQPVYEIDFNYVETVSLLMNNVRFQLIEATTKEYYQDPRDVSIQGLPYQYYIERNELGKYFIYLYWIPNQVYQLNLKVANGLESNYLINDSIPDYLDFYANYFMYVLADRICTFNSISTPAQTTSTLDQMQEEIDNMLVPDLVATKSGFLTKRTPQNYAYANLGKGWVP